jgi:hypothetical protein
MSETLRFTAAEAAFVLQEPIKSVKKALDEGPIRPVLFRKAGTAVRAIDWSDLLYLYVVRVLRDELTPKARSEFYEALRVRGEINESRCPEQSKNWIPNVVGATRKAAATLAG